MIQFGSYKNKEYQDMSEVRNVARLDASALKR